MLDYGKAQALLCRQGKRWNVCAPKRAPKMPMAWDPTRSHAWDRVLGAIGFSSCDETRWIYTHMPTEDRMGVTIIVALDDDGMFRCTMTVDTLETENNSAWDNPANAFTDPLAAAQWAGKHVLTQLRRAYQALDAINMVLERAQ